MQKLHSIKIWFKNIPANLRSFHTRVVEKSKNENKSVFSVGLKETAISLRKPAKYFVIFCIAGLIIVPIATYLYFVRDLSSKEKILSRKNEGVILLDRNSEPFFAFYDARTKKTIPYSDISEDLRNAIVSVEDRNFYTHRGVSPTSVIRAVLTNLQEQEISIGGSTITQQLVKNALLSPDRNFLRKYQELILALDIERRYSKEDILEMYINTAYFGENAFGAETAANAYFGKSAQDLTLAESALLAGILPAPSAYSPISGSRERAFARQEVVLDEMRKQGYISDEEYNTALNEKISFNPQAEDLNVVAPHFAIMVKDQLIEKYGEQKVAQSGFIVTTTLDLEYQKYAEEVVAAQVARLRGNDATNGAAVILDPKTGEIIALVGSHDWFDEENGKINMTLRPRQPGSSFKPIIYAAALDEKVITPATVLEDEAVTFGSYKPRNYDNRFRGDVLARFALANSLNIPAIHVLDRLGLEKAIDFAENMGITTLNKETDYGLPFVLGSAEVPLAEMTSAYAVFASGGELAERTTILKIEDKNKREVFRFEPSLTRVLGRGVSFQISSILSDNAARAETFGGSLTISRPAAVKTGTTEDYKDALTLGYTPQVVVGVWVGNNDNTPMDSVAGSLGAAPIWRQLMEYYLRGKTIERFAKPINIDQQEVCRENGLKALSATSSAYMEYFLPGTVPRGNCTEENLTPSPSENPTPTPTNQPVDTPVPTTIQAQEPTSTPVIPEPTATPTLTPTLIPPSPTI